MSSLRSSKAKIVTAAIRPATPSMPAIIRLVLAPPPEKASSAIASTGMASLAKLFHTPATVSETELREREKPHESYIA
jgi:hypothetical protein